MNNSRLKIALYLLLIFAAGALSGGSLMRKQAISSQASHGPHGPPPSPGKMCDFILNEWKEKIGLTDEQAVRIRPLLETGMEEVRVVQERSVQQVRETMQKTDARIAAELNPEQKAKFEQWQKERDQRRPKHPPFVPGHHGPGPGPGREEGAPKVDRPEPPA